MVQRLKLCAPKAGGLGSVLGQGRSHMLQRKIPLAATKTQCTQIKINIKEKKRASLVVQWLRICLAMQGTLI